MKYLALAASLFVLPAYAGNDPPPVDVVTRADVDKAVEGMFRGSWTRREKIAWSAATVAHLADLATTINGLNDGCIEINPLVGNNPSNGTLIAFKVAVIGFDYWLQSKSFPNSWVYSAVSGTVAGLAAIHNSQVDCRS